MSTNKKQQWVEAIPYGLVGGIAPGMSLLVFKEKKGEERFAICLSKLQSQVAVQQETQRENTFSFLTPLLNSIGVQPQKAYFITKGKNREPSLEVHFSGSKEFIYTFKARESLAFCIQHKCQFFCTYDFIDKVRELKFSGSLRKDRRNSPLSLN